MEDFNTYRNKVLQQNLRENAMMAQAAPCAACGVGDDFTANKYFGNMRFSPKLRKKLTHKQERSKTGLI
jgi:hypothetical protein